MAWKVPGAVALDYGLGLACSGRGGRTFVCRHSDLDCGVSPRVEALRGDDGGDHIVGQLAG